MDYEVLKAKLAQHGSLTAREWDCFDSLQRKFEPEAYAARRVKAKHNIALTYARTLSIDDLETILAEKKKCSRGHQQ